MSLFQQVIRPLRNCGVAGEILVRQLCFSQGQQAGRNWKNLAINYFRYFAAINWKHKIIQFSRSNTARKLLACGGGGGGGGLLAASFWEQKKAEEKGVAAPVTDQERKLRAVIDKADILYQNYLMDNVYAGLKRFASYERSDILWRLARVTCELAKQTKSKAQKKELMYEAFGYAERALACEPKEGDFAVHKWYAIMLNYIGELEGSKAQLRNSWKVKEHLERALELNPDDATTWHILGVWHFTFADMPSYQRFLASAIFECPPDSTYPEARRIFEKAEAIAPDFYSMNKVMLAKVYLALGDGRLAEPLLDDVFVRMVVSPDDLAAKEEAMRLMKKCGFCTKLHEQGM